MLDNVTAKQSAMRWTAEQWLGITVTDRSLLVSAAAGSGKTAVLAQRCVYLVCDAPAPCDVDELLVVTFTEKAAEEMRGRITRALRQREETAPSPRLARQLALVDQAHVSTLHAFCARLLRQHFHLVGLDPGFTVMDADDASLLRRDILRELFERRYDEEDGRFARLVDGYGQGDDERIARQVLHVHELLTSVVNPAHWIAQAHERIAEAIDLPLEASELGRELLRVVERGLASLRQRCDKAISTVAALGFPTYAAYLQNLAATLRDWDEKFRNGGTDALAEVTRDPPWPRLPTVRGDSPEKELAKSLIDAVRSEAKEGEWRDILRFSTRQWQEGLEKMRPHAEVFLELVEQFGAEYARAKKQVRGVDFADLERFTLAALCHSPAEPGKPSPAARALHERFAHVLVDEFQDINEVQDAILTLVSRECVAKENGRPNLFCVGDVKQSIYRFRLAEARRFLDRQQAFRAPDSHGRVIDLQANFRSRRPLLDALNSIFSRLMTADAVDIEYDQTHWLLGKVDYPACDDGASFAGAPIELHLLPDALTDGEATDEAGDKCDAEEEPDEATRTEREAMLIARRIRAMLGMDPGTRRMKVMDRGPGDSLTPREAQFRDVVVLLRSMKFKADQYADVLRQHGIPVHAASSAGYFASTEVRDVVSLLSLMDNQRQDIPLAGILRSPLGELEQAETALARIRAAYPASLAFHEAAIRYAAEKQDAIARSLAEFFNRLGRWRQAAQRHPLADVIWSIYHETGYLTYVAGLDKGEQRVRNLLDLHERAAQFGRFQSRGLSRFMRFLEQLQEESDLGQAATVSEAEDVVRIMSVHASKGLEFPIVFLPDLGKRINLQSCQGPILADRGAGLGMVVVDDAKRCRYPSLASTLVRNRLRQQSLAEELRVLYVAMTRAREHLVLIGTARAKMPEKWVTRWHDHRGPMPTDAMLSAATMLDWIGPAEVMTRVEPRPIFYARAYDPGEVAAWRTPASLRTTVSPLQIRLTKFQSLPDKPPMTEAARTVIERLSLNYPYINYSDVPASQSVTSAGHAEAAETGLAPAAASAGMPPRLPPRPRFLELTELSAAERGTATHLALQYVRFSSPCGVSEIAVQIEDLVARRLLAPAAAKAVDLETIAWLMGTPVGQLLSRNPRAVRRELPVNFPRPFEAAQHESPLDRVMVRGRIDVLILGEQSATLLDYKTDRITRDGVAARAALYKPQLDAYRDAIHRIVNKPVNDVYLAFLTPRVMHRL